MIDNNYELKSKKHEKVAQICTAVIPQLENTFNFPACVNLIQIEACLCSLFGEENIFLTGLFEELFIESEFIDLDILREKKLYHSLIVSFMDDMHFKESIA